MGKKMLIDAAHREETRVAVVSGNRVENFDFESEAKRPLRGNIYLAKVTRVEPSLQAAFVEYGGNRHGFLAFNEIHPDYYQIPVADRQKLLEAEAAEHRAEAEEEDAEAEGRAPARADADADTDSDGDAPDNEDNADSIAARAPKAESLSTDDDAGGDTEEAAAESDDDGETAADIEEIEDDDEAEEVETAAAAADEDDDELRADADSGDAADDEDEDEDEDVDGEDGGEESAGADDEPAQSKADGGGRGQRGRGRRGRNGRGSRDDQPRRRSRPRPYKIQEVIKRRQILLVQVVKEERGNKGAALTTYLSLAGRYCVLMPNTARGGGISRKITNPADRRRLKEAMSEMEVAEGMGLIVRTAGANRTKAEIKRDFDYLLRLWENIRDLTLKSTAPALIYEEGDLIKRSIRDLYSKDIDEIVVDGDAAYKDAKEFMRMLMPSHAKNVKRYGDRDPIYQRFGVQQELDSLLEPTVTLKSGGYIVINPTEALVSIDVNSGKSTKEHNVEATALSTNMEAAEEIARQLRLRDMAGLIVIDFIDMDEPRNNRAVERKLKDSLKQDRARIQVGRISSFGLLEMSRQRMRSGVLEGSTEVCPHCKGTGFVRSTESTALQVLRAIEMEALKGKAKALDVSVPTAVAVYILNQKRAKLLDIERRCRVSIYLLADAALIAPDYSIKRTDDRTPDESADPDALSMESAFDEDDEPDAISAEEADTDETDADDTESHAGADDRSGDAGEDGKPRKRRRRSRSRRKSAAQEGGDDDAGDDDDTGEAEAGDGDSARAASDDDTDDDGKPRKRRRRGRRGGRRHRRSAGSDAEKGDAEKGDAEMDDAGNASAERSGRTQETADARDGRPAGSTPGTDDEATDDTDAPILVGYSSRATDPVVVTQSREAADDASDATPAGDTAPAETGNGHAPEPAQEAREESQTAPAGEAGPAPAAASEDVSDTGEPGDESDTPSDTAAPEGPPKRGWWQRRLSS